MSTGKSNNIGELNGRVLNVSADLPDLRDRLYQPALLDLKLSMSPPGPSQSPILDQGEEGACTGFALASAINLQNGLRKAQLNSQSVFSSLPTNVSPRMLYEMARLHDEWPGEEYEGSSIRGALKGFFHNGACDENLAPYKAGEKNWFLTVEQSKNARNVGLGAYYRLRPEIIDYHAALNETGVVYISAKVHRGWQNPKKGIIKQSNVHEGGHAFVIVGYNQNGFLIQNSWGREWGGYAGHGGVAEWSYADWAENVMDAWVLRLAVPTPEYFDLTHIPNSEAEVASFKSEIFFAPKRKEILGHFVHLDDGDLDEKGRYATTIDSLEETARLLVKDETRENGEKSKYKHLLFYMHGGLNNIYGSAKRIKKMKEVYKRNGIYPIHFMWETGFSEELLDLLLGVFKKSKDRVGGFTDKSDLVIEDFARKPGRAIWRDIKTDAALSFKKSGGGVKALQILLEGNRKRKKPLKIHFAGHSAGAVLLAELLKAKKLIDKNLAIDSVSLMAPACTVDLFNKAYAPLIGKSAGIRQLNQYNLIDQRELDDSVGPYRKSLLYFVSRAFEEDRKKNPEMPLLGMEKHCSKLPTNNAHKIIYAGGTNSVTNSKTHGGFDNDRATMNHILATIIGKKPSSSMAFQEHDLKGY